MLELIDDVFLSLPSNDPVKDEPLAYVECVSLEPLRRRRIGWYYHTTQRVELSDRLAICAACTNLLRRCSVKLWKAYRRLEEYAKFVGFVWSGPIRWMGYGKLVEVTLYYYYPHPRRKRWRRHQEMRLLFAVPVSFRDYDTFLKKHIAELDEIGRTILECLFGLEYAWGVEFDASETLKAGIRLVTKEVIETIEQAAAKLGIDVDIPLPWVPLSPGGIERTWCNGVYRAPYGWLGYIIFDYRRQFGYALNYGYDSKTYGCAPSILEYQCEWFRWW